MVANDRANSYIYCCCHQPIREAGEGTSRFFRASLLVLVGLVRRFRSGDVRPRSGSAVTLGRLLASASVCEYAGHTGHLSDSQSSETSQSPLCIPVTCASSKWMLLAVMCPFLVLNGMRH